MTPPPGGVLHCAGSGPRAALMPCDAGLQGLRDSFRRSMRQARSSVAALGSALVACPCDSRRLGGTRDQARAGGRRAVEGPAHGRSAATELFARAIGTHGGLSCPCPEALGEAACHAARTGSGFGPAGRVAAWKRGAGIGPAFRRPAPLAATSAAGPWLSVSCGRGLMCPAAQEIRELMGKKE